MATVGVERADEDAWERVAAVRLRALRDAPDAFGSSLAREEGFAERHWRLRLRGTPTWLAVVDGADVGLVSVVAEPGAPASERHLVSLWVAPRTRGAGAGRALLGAAETWARADGATRVTLWLVEGNDHAAALYAACGYAPTGEQTPLLRDPGRTEHLWAKELPAD